MFSHYTKLSRWAVLGLLSLPVASLAQTAPSDSTQLQYSEAEQQPAATEAPRLEVQETHLWKLGLNNFLPGKRTFGDAYHYSRVGVHIGYEQRIRQSAWSLTAEASPAHIRYQGPNDAAVRTGLGLRTQVGGRYYHNLNGRLRRGRSAGNFSGNYLALLVGSGIGRQAHETPFYQFYPQGKAVMVDAALVYGLQRRLGRFGFVDANVGLSRVMTPGDAYTPRIGLNGSVRVGLALNRHTASAPRPQSKALPESLQPKLFAGVAAGAYSYHVTFEGPDPYPRQSLIDSKRPGSASYDQLISGLITYAGYQILPRLGVQVGLMKNWEEQKGIQIDPSRFVMYETTVNIQNLMVPVQVRYAVMPRFLTRLQAEVLAGVTPFWTRVRYRDHSVGDGVPAESNSFERCKSSLHGTMGVSAAYGLGARRRVQVLGEVVANLAMRNDYNAPSRPVRAGAIVGLRYRFLYR